MKHKNSEFRSCPKSPAKGNCEPRFVQSKTLTNQVFQDNGKIELSEACLEFTLLRGAYATVLLREIMKPKDLIKAGF